MRFGDLHIISEAELQRLYKVFRPANLDEKRQLEGQIDEMHHQLESLQRDYDAAVEAGDVAVDRSARDRRVRRAVLLERRDMVEKIELLEEQVRNLTDAVQHPPDEDKPKTEKNVLQSLLDQAQSKIGFSDDLTTGAVQTYIERQLRLRGDDSAESILAEVLAGGIDADDDLGEPSEEITG